MLPPACVFGKKCGSWAEPWDKILVLITVMAL
jgi:hypothetical protein